MQDGRLSSRVIDSSTDRLFPALEKQVHPARAPNKPPPEAAITASVWRYIDHFVPAAGDDARAEQPRARGLVALCITATVCSVFVQTLRLWMKPEQHLMPFVSWALSTALFAVMPWVLKRTGNVAFAASLAATAVFVGSLGVALVEGGLASPNALVLAGAVAVAFTLGGRRSGLTLCGLATLATLSMFVLGRLGWIASTPALDPTTLDVVRASVLCMMFLAFGLVGEAYHYERRTYEERLRQKAEQLAIARDQALLAARAKAEFLANMSHEIRTPLNGVLGLAELMLHSDLPAAHKQTLATIRSSGQALLSVINDVLDLSKLEAGELHLESEAFPLRDCIEEVLALFANDALCKGLELNLLMSKACPASVRGDAARLRQVLINLVGNAIKFTERGDVTISVDAEATGSLRIAVRDTGIGIRKEHCGRIFSAFSQGDASTSRKFGGTGLGLAISQRLVRRMDGELSVESELGRGSCFALVVPLRTVARDDITPPAALRGRRVLVVESHPITAQACQQVLEEAGCRVQLASTAADLGKAFSRMPDPEIVIVDSSVQSRATVDRALDELAPRARRMLLRTPAEVERHPLATSGYTGEALKPPLGRTLWDALLRCLDEPQRPPSHMPDNPFDPQFAERHPLRILVAEDNLINQKVILAMLQRLGYNAGLAEDGHEVLSALRSQVFDVVLLDMHMPGMDGLEAARRMRAELVPERMPTLLAVTASVLPEQCDAYRMAGVQETVAKPVQPQLLLRALERVPRLAGPSDRHAC